MPDLASSRSLLTGSRGLVIGRSTPMVSSFCSIAKIRSLTLLLCKGLSCPRSRGVPKAPVRKPLVFNLPKSPGRLPMFRLILWLRKLPSTSEFESSDGRRWESSGLSNGPAPDFSFIVIFESRMAPNPCLVGYHAIFILGTPPPLPGGGSALNGPILTSRKGETYFL